MKKIRTKKPKRIRLYQWDKELKNYTPWYSRLLNTAEVQAAETRSIYESAYRPSTWTMMEELIHPHRLRSTQVRGYSLLMSPEEATAFLLKWS